MEKYGNGNKQSFRLVLVILSVVKKRLFPSIGLLTLRPFKRLLSINVAAKRTSVFLSSNASVSLYTCSACRSSRKWLLSMSANCLHKLTQKGKNLRMGQMEKGKYSGEAGKGYTHSLDGELSVLVQ